MRRSDREITDYDKMLEIAKKCDCLRLGLLDDNEVYITKGYDGKYKLSEMM